MKPVILGLAAVTAMCGAAAAQPAPKPAFVPMDAAHDGTVAAIVTCQKNGYQVAAAVVDAKGNPRLDIVLDDAYYLAGQFALAKAKTAALTGETTASLAARKSDPAVAKRIMENGGGDSAGGLPIMGANGQVVGGLGVAGAPGGDKDDVCAHAALEAIKAKLK